MQQQAAYMWKFSQPKMYDPGGNSSFVTQELIMYHFYVFQKKSPELQCHLEQDKQQLRPSHIISVNYLDLDQALLPTSLKFRANSHVKSFFIQNQGEFQVENQVHERNYNRATIHHFYHVRSSSSSFYSFVSVFLDHR